MFQFVLFSLTLTATPHDIHNPYRTCAAQRGTTVHTSTVTPIICYGNCKIYIDDSGRRYKAPVCQRRLPRRRPTYGAPAVSTYRAPQRTAPAPQVREEGSQVAPPNSIVTLKNDRLDLTPHTTSLFPTAITLPKGRKFQDYKFFGLLSGVQYGVTDRLEMGFKVATPFVIALLIEPETIEYFLKWGVHVNMKYQLIKGDSFNLAVSGSGPSPSGEIIATLGGPDASLTAALGGMHFLDTDVNFMWYRLSGKLRISNKTQLFAEYFQLTEMESGFNGEGIYFASLALRRFWGRFNVDFGLGSIGEVDDNEGFPLIYLNFGYSQ